MRLFVDESPYNLIFREFTKFGQNWTNLDSKLDYFGCTQTLVITGFFNKMLIFGQ